nr:unnamed protein product [Digitaria exilis]
MCVAALVNPSSIAGHRAETCRRERAAVDGWTAGACGGLAVGRRSGAERARVAVVSRVSSSASRGRGRKSAAWERRGT